MGTANVVARELRLPCDPEGSARLIASGLTRSMDLGYHGGRRFLLGGGAGIDAAVVKVVSENRGRRSGLRHWVGPALREGWDYAHPRMCVMVDGKLVGEDVQYAIVGNCRYSAGVFPATPKAQIDDGLLDVCLLRNLGRRRLLTLAFTVWNPSFIEHVDVRYAQGRDVEIRPLNGVPIPLQIDGDPRGTLPADFSIRPRALTVIGDRR
jgi:diacylglycerol kinase family enzyme